MLERPGLLILVTLLSSACHSGVLQQPHEATSILRTAIDPAVTESQVICAGDGVEGDEYGVSVASAGDIDGDGFADVLVGAAGVDDMGSWGGAAYVYRGGPDGLDRKTELKLLPTSLGESHTFGLAVSSAGDVNGDGYDDVIIGAQGDDSHGNNTGAAYLYLGSSTGIDLSSEVKLQASDAAAVHNFGADASYAGDVNGDGYDDIVVGGGAGAYVYHGSADGIDLDSETKLTPASGESAGYGGDVGTAGDVNGDGYDDIVVGAGEDETTDDRSGAAFIYLGSASGIDPSSELKILASDSARTSHFGEVLAGIGDTNGDGYDDIAVGSYLADGACFNCGAVYVYRGSADGIDPSSELILFADFTEEYLYFGAAVAPAGDMDGDGNPDLLVGADTPTGGWAWLLLADGDGFVHERRMQNAASETMDEFGTSVSGIGDTNGDGVREVLVGAWSSNSCGAGAGAAFVFGGDCVESTWYADGDGDGYGDPDSSVDSCEALSGYVGDSNDCDDGDAAINPGVDEDCADGLDNDCDGLIDLQDDECDDPDDTEAPDDSDSPDDTGPADDDTASADDDEPDDGCACSSADPVGFAGLFGLLGLSLVTARRRPGHRR